MIRLADGQSLLQKAFLRGALLNGVDPILTVTNRELFFKTRWGFAGGAGDHALMLFAGLIVFNAFAQCLAQRTALSARMISTGSDSRLLATHTPDRLIVRPSVYSAG